MISGLVKILTAAQIREVDRLSTTRYGVPSLLLMENAGMRVVEAIEARFQSLADKTIGIICGKGNNGGDGFVVARQLLNKGVAPLVFLCGDAAEVRGDARTNLDILQAIGAAPAEVRSRASWARAKQQLKDADIIVDALLGTGLNKPATGLLGSVIASLADEFPRASVVSIDVPSGLPADGARPIGPSVRADLTVTFTALKPALALAPNCERAGEVIVAEIGNPRPLVERANHRWNWITPQMFESARGSRAAATNKGDYGKALVVGGSRGKSGAAAMAGQAALRSGAGLVTVAVPASALPVVAASMPELMTEALEETSGGGAALQPIDRIMEGKTVLAVGPGLGARSQTKQLVRQIVRDATVPVIVDADGLNAFAGDLRGLRGSAKQLRIVTPHPGEMARLIGRNIASVENDRVGVALEFARSQRVYVVLKGFRTVVATPDGTVFINSTGNPGMATAGTGDILTGMIAGILGQEHLGTFIERLCLAVFLHGLAGDIAAKELGEESMVATDILRSLSQAWSVIRPPVK
jgi:NAD(P)H-hydrate epimerase